MDPTSDYSNQKKEKTRREKHPDAAGPRPDEQRYRELFEHSRDAVAITDRYNRVIEANQAALDLFGYTREEMEGFDFQNFYAHPQDALRFLAAVTKSGAVKDYEVILRKKDGTRMDCLFTVSTRYGPDGSVEGYQGIIRDISDRKRAERALRENRELFRSLAEDAPFGISIMGSDGRFKYFNRKFLEIFGYSGNDLPDKETWFQKAYPDEKYRQMVADIWHKDREKKMVPGELKDRIFMVRCKNGTDRVIHFRSIAMRHGDEFITYEDITAHARAKEALQASEQRYRLLVENALFGLFVMEFPFGRVIYFNRCLREMFGYGPEEVLDITIWDLIHPDDHTRAKKRLEDKMNSETPPVDTATYTAIRKDGSVFRMEVHSWPTTYEGRSVLQGVIRDVTETERLERRLREAQKLKAIGSLAGGIAHNFNNLLMAIQGNASLVLLNTDPDHPDHQRLKNIEKHVQKGATLTRQLLGFARSGKYRARDTDLNPLVIQNLEMFAATRKELTVQARYQNGIWCVAADREQIEQVLMDILINAWQAMPGGGDLRVTTENRMIDKPHSDALRIRPGKYVRISVSDSGPGMDAETRDRIFDPFFTTKEVGRGKGLGLAAAYGIIENHGGIIHVTSEEGRGTTFDIYLPAVPDPPPKKRGAVPLSPAPGGETVLLVDDEPMILQVGEEMLKRLGYRVLVADNGETALDLYEKNRNAVAAVVLDMIMPGMGGGEIYDRLKAVDPSVKVLLSSGYSRDGQAGEILDRGCDGFIQKPFTLEKLSENLREILAPS